MNAEPGKGADTFRNWLAFFLISAFVAVLPLLVFKTIPGENKEIIVYMIGQLSGMATTAIGFYYISKAGQDAADAKRADNTGAAFRAIEAAANSTPIDSAPAAEAAEAVADAAVDKAAEIKGE
ncbi:MAG TPA: hypothetical protein VM760_08900 [Sphingomicrobium sp.]|nr:hypothetical protein [Sphingomicrobium sp.]